MPEDEGAAGSGTKGFALHLPTWGWALIAGAGLGLIYFVRRKSAAASTPADSSGSSENPNATDIIPVDMGGDDSADAQLLAAIQKLQGNPSTLKPGPPPMGGPIRIPPKVPIPVPAPPKGKPPAPPKAPQSTWVKVNSFAQMQAVARQYGHTWQELWAYQLLNGVRPASTQATLRKRGARNAFAHGSEVAVPTSWKKK